MSKLDPKSTPGRRMVSASRECIAKLERLHLAQITNLQGPRLAVLAEGVKQAQERFDVLVNSRGLIVGDTVIITREGPYKDVPVVVDALEGRGSRLRTVLPTGPELVIEATDAELLTPRGMQKNEGAQG